MTQYQTSTLQPSKYLSQLEAAGSKSVLLKESFPLPSDFEPTHQRAGSAAKFGSPYTIKPPNITDFKPKGGVARAGTITHSKHVAVSTAIEAEMVEARVKKL